ncbi:MAG: OmpA family protein [Saprospiraceae bacterium]
MKFQLLSLLLILLATATASAQVAPPEKPNNPNAYHAISARILSIDYGIDREEDLSRTFGLELGYRRQLGKYLGLAVPFKIGLIDVGGLENLNFFSADLLAHIYPAGSDSRISPYLLGGIGIVSEDFDRSNRQIPLGAGLNLRLGESSYLTLQGEYRLSSEDLRNNLQIGLGYTYRISSLDDDGDGIVNRNDACPQQAGPANLDGCPDRDGDGIIDPRDACPDAPGPGTKDGCPDTDGDGVTDALDDCPEVPGTLRGCPDSDEDGITDADDACPLFAGTAEHQGCPDTDGDGIFDDLDKCPTQPAPGTADGCPAADRDGDGIADAADRCPDAAGSATTGGCPDADGDGVADQDDACPDVAGPFRGCPDTDGDGVHDGDDRCPDEPGLTNNQGCPAVEEEVRETLAFAAQAVQFETGSAKLRASSDDILDQIVTIMQNYPSYSLVIEGHTDDVGEADSNLRLSEERARSCYEYLLGKGINPRRISYRGFGETQPRDTNKTAAGRKRNRRVEFDLRLL